VPKEMNLGTQIAQLVDEAQGTCESIRPPDALLFGRLRLFCSWDVDQIIEHGGTLSIISAMHFTRSDPFPLERAEFDEKLRKLQAYTQKARENGVTVMSYVSQNVSTSCQADPSGWIMSDVWKDDDWWNRYADLYGAKPEDEPSEWLQIGADGVYGGHVWIPPEATDKRYYEVRGNPNSPGFRQYMGGIINILLEAGIGGIYLDHSELMQVHSRDSMRCFRDFLAARYTPEELQDHFGIDDLSKTTPAVEKDDPLFPETLLFQAASEAEFHRYLLDLGRRRNPDFLICGNLWGGFGFQNAALHGSDIQLAGAVDTFLYSELATGTESAEHGQRNIPGTRNGIRTSMSPLIRILVASSRTHAATSYTYYPQAPNPIPTEEALYNIQRLTMAEAFANHTAFRRVEHQHVPPVHRAAKTVYDLLRSVESDILGAEMGSNVAIVASLQGGYFGHYSYHREASRALADAGIAHEMIAPCDIHSDKLSQYRAVILPNIAVLSDDAYRALTAFQANGGAVIGFGSLATLGLRGDPGPAADELAEGFTVLPIDPDQLAADNADVRAEDTQHSAWARAEWPATLKPTMDKLVAAVESACPNTLTARLHNPRGVEITAMKRPGSDDLILNLVNYAVDIDGNVTPAKDVEVSVSLEGREIEQIDYHALDGVNETITAETADGVGSFTISEVAIYGIALIRFASS